MLKRWRVEPGEWVVIGGLVIVTALVFGAVVWQMIYNIPGSDYQGHIEFTILLQQQFELSRAHVLFQILIIGLTAVLPITKQAAAWVIAIIFYELTALILYALIRSTVRSGWRQWVGAALGAFVLLLVTPITLFTLPARNLYFGYVSVNVLHNPTMVLLKPFALLLFALTIAILQREIRLSRRVVAASFLLVLGSMLAKPNFALVLLPALLVVATYRLLRGDRADLTPLFAALILPMLILLAVEYAAQFLWVDQGGVGIRFAPLLTITYWDRAPELLPLKLILSILFPLLVYLAYWRRAVHETALNVAWLVFLIGGAQMYLLAEGGDRFRDANFWWSAQIGLFVLFVVSTLSWVRHQRERPTWRGLLCFAALVLHLASGIVYYTLQFHAASMSDWW